MRNNRFATPSFPAAALLTLLLAIGCGPEDTGGNNGNSATDGGDASNGSDAGQTGTDGGNANATVPTVLSHEPMHGDVGVALNGNVSAVFSEPMDPATMDGDAFVVTTGNPGTTVQGVVLYSQDTATFWPASRLAGDTEYTVTITTEAKSAKAVPLAEQKSWTFTTGTALVPSPPVQLGTAGDFVILAKSGISTVPPSAITGNVAVSPAAASYITGFTLTADSSNVFSTSSQVTGQVFSADYASPTPSNLTTAVGDMQLAFTDAAGRPPDFTELGAGDVGGQTLQEGVYQWGTGLLIPTDLTLQGSATDVWIFQIAGDLTVANGVRVILSGGALPKNIFWQVSGKVELGTTSHFEGVILGQTAVTMGTGGTLNGRILAQTAVELDSNTIVQPAQ